MKKYAVALFDVQHSEGSGPSGSPLQFQRKRPCTPSPADGQFWPGIQTNAVVAKISQETLAEMIGTNEQLRK